MLSRSLFVPFVFLSSLSAAEPIKVGVLGLDNYQAVAFTQLFHDPKAAGDLAGIRVVAAFPAGSPDVERRTLWEMTQIAKELMGFEDSDFKHVVRSVMPHATDDYIAMRTREMVFSEMALQMKCTAHIQAAVELIYESFPRAGSGGDFHPLKWPSILASIVSHNGFTLVPQP